MAVKVSAKDIFHCGEKNEKYIMINDYTDDICRKNDDDMWNVHNADAKTISLIVSLYKSKNLLQQFAPSSPLYIWQGSERA